MHIIDTFATRITEPIDPIVKVADRQPERLLYELSNLIVTAQWEQHFRRIFDAWAETADNRNAVDPGIWISGFFGSGKSLLMKVLGIVLEGGELVGKSVDDVFLDRLPAGSPDRAEIRRLLTAIRRKTTVSAVGGNIHALQASSNDPLALIAFKLFAVEQGYTNNWAFAWGIEYYIDAAGKQQAFQQRAEELTGKKWGRLQRDTAINLEKLKQAAAEILPDYFSGPDAVQSTLDAVTKVSISPNDVIDRLVRWCDLHDADHRRHKLLLQLDEIGQWIASGDSNERIMQVQALVETASVRGEGRIWIAVTAHGDVQALQANVQQEQYAKINQRFSQKIKLSNDDMSVVVEERLLQKTKVGNDELAARFAAHLGQIADLGSLKNTRRVYPAPTVPSFPLCYPYLPWTISVVPDVVRGIAQAANRGDALTGATRTMIAVVQGGILETGVLQSSVGRLIPLVDLYRQLEADVSVETKTDLNSITNKVPEATNLTRRVAIALYLLGQAQHIPCLIENIARALVSDLDDNLSALSARIEPELTRLIKAGYVKLVGEEYLFLTTQQRSFQDKVRERQNEFRFQNNKLSEALKEFERDELFQLNHLQVQSRNLVLRLLMDGRVVETGQSRVAVQILSPLQRALDPSIDNDETLRQRSNQDQEVFLVRMEQAPTLRDALALLVATRDVADRVITANPQSQEAEVARQAKLNDLPSHESTVRAQLRMSMRTAQIFFRGSSYPLSGGTSDIARALLAQLLPMVYHRLGEVQHRVANEDVAVKAALNGSFTNMDIQLLNVLKGDGTVNESSPLLSTLRGLLPLESNGLAPRDAAELRQTFENPPYGWDGNAIKVGLALLLRAGLCKLIIEGKPVADPQDPNAFLSLSKDQRFKQLRVYAVRTDLDTQVLIIARGFFETLFPAAKSPPLVAATFNNALGDELAKLSTRSVVLQQWATAAGFPLPIECTNGIAIIGDLIASPNAVARVPLFNERHDDILTLVELLDLLEAFQKTHAATFKTVRDYFNQMINAGLAVPELQRFLTRFNTVQTERRFYEAQRWQELIRSRGEAEIAVAIQVARWAAEGRQRAEATITRIPDLVRELGANDEQIAEHTPLLAKPFEDLVAGISEPPSLAGTRSLDAQLGMLELNLRGELERLSGLFRPMPLPPEPTKLVRGGDSLPYRGIKLLKYVPDQSISSVDELDSILADIRANVLAALESGE